jgi:hypothetical protein
MSIDEQRWRAAPDKHELATGPGPGPGPGGQRGEPARPHGPMRGRVPERSVGAPRLARKGHVRTYATYDLITACFN